MRTPVLPEGPYSPDGCSYLIIVSLQRFNYGGPIQRENRP